MYVKHCCISLNKGRVRGLEGINSQTTVHDPGPQISARKIRFYEDKTPNFRDKPVHLCGKKIKLSAIFMRNRLALTVWATTPCFEAAFSISFKLKIDFVEWYIARILARFSSADIPFLTMVRLWSTPKGYASPLSRDGALCVVEYVHCGQKYMNIYTNDIIYSILALETTNTLSLLKLGVAYVFSYESSVALGVRSPGPRKKLRRYTDSIFFKDSVRLNVGWHSGGNGSD